MLRHDLDADNLSQAGEDVAEVIEACLRMGQSLAVEDWITRQETALGRRLRPGKPGPKPAPPKVIT